MHRKSSNVLNSQPLSISELTRVTSHFRIGESTFPPPPPPPPPQPDDSEPPILTIIQPPQGSVVNLAAGQPLTVFGSASDNVGIDYVEASLDGEQFIRASGNSSWSINFPAVTGTRIVQARTRDLAGNLSATKISVFTVLTPNGPPPPPPPTSSNKTGVYVPMYNNSMLQGILQQADAHPSLPFIVAINPDSGPGDIYVPQQPGVIPPAGGTIANIPTKSSVQNAIAQLRQRPNIIVIGYIASWRAEATNNPPEGNRWSCCSGQYNSHCDVVYSMDRNQVNNIRANGVMVRGSGGCGVPSSGLHVTRRALYIPELIDRYKTVYAGVQGLMIDEFSSSGDSGNTNKRDFYQAYVNYARQSPNPLPFIVGNPGAMPASWAYNMLDNISVYENNNYFSALSNAQSAYSQAGNNKKKIKVLIHGQEFLPSTSQIQELAKWAGYIYIAQDADWQNLESYFGTMCNILDSI